MQRTSSSLLLATAGATAVSANGVSHTTAKAKKAVTVDRVARPHADTAHSFVQTALAAERIAIAFYYTALTTPAILRHPQLGGGSSNPNDPGLPPNGNPHRVRYLQAALDAEAKHADLLSAAGASSRLTHVYFPAGTFTRLGTSLQPDTFLGVLDQLETLTIGLYLAAVAQLSTPSHLDLAQLAAQLAAVEAEHRMLGRVIADIKPANNLTLEKEPFASIDEAGSALRPFLSGHGFAGRAAHQVALPSRAHIARVVGKYGTRRVSGFL